MSDPISEISLNTGDDMEAANNSAQDEDNFNVLDTSEDLMDEDLEKIKARVKEMEEEAEKIKQLQYEVDKTDIGSAGLLNLSLEEKMEADGRSVYVGNVDYSATAEELEQHFHGCGPINRVTIQCDKFTSHPKGFAYIEFAEKDSVITSAALDETVFRGRQIKVLPKRTNRPGISSTNRPPRGSRFRRPTRPSYRGYGGYRPMRRPYRRRVAYYPY